MTAGVLEHPLVRDYLRRLDAACAALPAVQARELRDQVIDHLDEALTADASADEIGAELGRLGSPAELAAEASRPDPRPPAARLRNRLSRLSWRTWALIAASVVLIVVPVTGVAIYLSSVNGANPLVQGGIGTWWFPKDQNARGATTTAGDVTQIAVPERWGQQQGIVVGVYNYSSWTQTIVGLAGAWAVPGALSPVLIAVGSDPPLGDADALWASQTRWNLPGSIPPHSYRLLRILWTSRICNQLGSTTSIQGVTLRVRVGLVTRTEDIQFNTAWAITGTRTSSPTSVCH